MKPIFAFSLFFFAIAQFLHAAVPTVIELWPKGVPHAMADAGPEENVNGRISKVQKPTLTYFPAIKSTGTAVVLCPGGGYDHLSMPVDGGDLVQWLNGLGIDVFVLKYRLKEYGHPAPLQDGLQAMRIVRSRATEFHLRPDHIGIFGGSAGGHVAASVGTLYDNPAGKTGSRLDAISARPDFMVLLYPVITMKGPFVHEGSRRSLLGTNPAPELIELLSLEDHVTPQTPPTFLVHTAEDGAVLLENSIQFYLALRKAGVPAELHLYRQGKHGFSITGNLGTTSGWNVRAAEWLRSLGMIP